jgi:prolipoprotein diacylglyceryltransferase
MFPPIVHIALETLAFALGGCCIGVHRTLPNNSRGSLDAVGVLAGAALGAALGSRGLYMLQYWGALTHQPLAIWLGGKTIVGACLARLWGVETAKRGLNWTASTGDGFCLCRFWPQSSLAALMSTLGIVGPDVWQRDGFAVGWNYGDGVARHPTSLYEILGRSDRFSPVWVTFHDPTGDRFRAFMVGYLALRFDWSFLNPRLVRPRRDSWRPSAGVHFSSNSMGVSSGTRLLWA